MNPTVSPTQNSSARSGVFQSFMAGLSRVNTYQLLALLIILGLLGILFYALYNSSVFGAVLGIGIVTAGASGMVGFLTGFLFGIPRTLSGDQATIQVGSSIRANTNLEQISDWLTKILVGVGLTQLSSVPSGLNQLTAFVAAGLGGIGGGQVAALAIIVHFSICGFIYGYLWARLILPNAFSEADEVVKQLEQDKADAVALDYMERQLAPNISGKPSEQELIKVFGEASDRIQEFVFYRAYKVRRENWVDNKSLMALTIPIFKALAQVDVDQSNHEYPGNLGFALKDKPNPDCAAAEAALTSAITIRGEETNGWAIYEYNRALCRIRQDENFKQHKKMADEQKKQAILSDLQAARQEGGFVKDLTDGDKTVKEWTALNKVVDSQPSGPADAVVVTG